MRPLKNLINFFSKDIPYILLIATLYLIITLSYLKTHSYIGTDGCNYALGTESIAQGNGFTRLGKPITLFMPLYSYASVPFYLIFKDSEFATRFVSILSALLSIPLLFFIAKRLFDPSVARIATLLTFTNTPYMKFSSSVLVESFFIFLLLVSVYIFVFYIWLNGKKFANLLALVMFSLFCGLASLTRPDGLFFYGLLLIFYFFVKPEKTYFKCGKILLGLFVFFLVLLPQFSFQYIHRGRIQFSDKFYNHFIAGEIYSYDDEDRYYKLNSPKIYETLGLPLPPGVEKAPEITEFNLLDYLITNRVFLLKKTLHNFPQLLKNLNEGIYFPIFWFFILIGIFTNLKNSEARLKIIFLLLFMLPVVFMTITFIQLRFVVPQIFFLYILAGIGLSQTLKYARQSRKKFFTVVYIAIMLFLVYYPFADNYHYIKDLNEPNRYVMYKKAGWWLKEQLDNPPQYYAVATKPWVCFYAGVQYEPLPWVDSVDTLVKYLQKIDADLLIIHKKEIKGKRETLMSLLDENQRVPGLIPIYTDKNKKDKIIIYKVEKP